MQEFATRKAIAHRMDLRLLNCLLRKYRMAVRIMKLTAILLAACLQLSARGLTQTVTISVKDAPLLTVLKAIKKQTGFVFFISSSEIKIAKNVSITANNLPLQQVLDMCFKDQPLTYTISGKWINILPRIQQTDKINDKTNFTAPPPANIDVSGKVMDENGAPLAGANVVEKGKQHGTTTNADGVFVLKGVAENGSLEISYIGYQTLIVPINNRTSIIVSIKQSDASLQEVVINKGYYTEAKIFSTGNVAKVSSKEIEQQPVQNPLLALQGRVPGVEVTQTTGAPGGGVTVRIQGRNSINSGLDPLIVIDGVPYVTQLVNSAYDQGLVKGGSPLNYINTADIESIDILKDADATAIYGSRAANGAILITTKKGKAGKTKLDLNMQYGWGQVAHKVDMMNTHQYLQMRWEGLKNSAQIPSSNPSASSPFVYAPDLMFWDTTRYTDWQKTLIGNTAQYSNFRASLSGGTPTVQYLVGGTFNRQTTVFPGSFDDKAGTCHFNISGISPNQKLKLQLTANYTYDQNHLPQVDLTGQALTMEPNAPPLYNLDGTLNWSQNSSGTSTWTNPLAYTVSTDFFNNTKNLISNAVLSYKVFPGLTLGSSFGYSDLQQNVYRPQRLEINKPERRSTSQRTADFTNRNMNTWIIEPQATYSNKISNGKLDALIGTTIQKSSYDYLLVTGSGFSNDLLMKTLSAANSISIGLNNSGVTRFNALFGRVGYNWNDKYIINLTGRRDGSNKFGDANKFHNFWSVGFGWIFSREKLIQQNIPILSFGKLRASYGTTGNDQIPDFSYLSVYSINNPTILYQNSIGLVANRISNPHIQWEETRKWQGGIDLGFFQDRLIIGATYARNRSSNQLIFYTLPNVTGFNYITENLPATIQNTSAEFSISSTNYKSRYFSWTTSINLTVPRNKVVDFPGIENTTYASGGSGVKIGQPVGVIQVSPFGGVNPVNGAYFFLDKNGNPNGSSGGLNVYISPNPIYYGGLLNSLSFRGITLDFLFQFVRKTGARDMFFYNGSKYPGEFLAGNSNQPVTVLNHWQKSGDINNRSLYLSSNGSFTLTPLTTSDSWYSYEASFIRLKNVSLSWQIPAALLKKAHIHSAQIFIHGQNLATITAYTGLDPETLSLNSLPPLRMMTMGAQIGF